LALSGDREGGDILIEELYRKVRIARRGGLSDRAAADHFGASRASMKNIMGASVPPGYRCRAQIKRPKLDGHTGFIDQWLRQDLTCQSRPGVVRRQIEWGFRAV
jgi:hypothetical protein